jgi:hypothetical protein
LRGCCPGVALPTFSSEQRHRLSLQIYLANLRKFALPNSLNTRSDWVGVGHVLDSQHLGLLRSEGDFDQPKKSAKRFYEKFAEHFPLLVLKGIMEFKDDIYNATAGYEDFIVALLVFRND